jgi:hypothetical protein
MKIIQKGRDQRGWAKELECTGHGNGGDGCGAKLLVERDDLFTTTSHARGEAEVFTTFECPSCEVSTDLTQAEASEAPHVLPSKTAWKDAQRGSSATEEFE